jgi:diguanylate cyclase (GGDEF)-like protein
LRELHRSIRMRLAVGFAASAVVLLATTVYFGSFVDRQREGLEHLRSDHEGFFILDRVSTSFTGYQAASIPKDTTDAQRVAAWQAFQQRLDAYRAVSPDNAQRIAQLATTFVERATAVRAAAHGSDAQALADATGSMRDDVILLGDAMRAGFDELDRRYKARLADEVTVQRRWQQAYRWAVGAAILLLVLYAVFLYQAIVRPLNATIAGIRALRRGQSLPALPRSGEFGQIATMIDELRDATQRLRDLAFYDPLTGLSSRARFEQVLADTIQRARAARQSLVVVLVEIRGLREIASAYGPAVVERCLRVAGERALFAVPSAHAPSRYGENRLAYLVLDSTVEMATVQALNVLGALRAPLAIDGLVLHLQAQAGVACSPADASDVSGLLAAAETALVSARSSHAGGVSAFDPAISESFRRDFQLLQDLDRGLADDEMVPHYQPIVDCARGEVIAAEALVRWQHPARGLLMPGEFLPIAERTGQVAAVDGRVVDRGVAQLAQWRARGHRLRLAVNLSPRYLSAATATRIESALRRHRVPASELMAELTETAVIAQGDDTDHVIRSLHTLGATICLDDFGTGYSSLAYVRRLPIGQLKVDRSFIAEIGRSVAAERIIEATLSLARSIEIAVIAEGVETREQMLWLMQRGCMRQQGYLFGHPQAAEAFEAGLEATTAELRSLLAPTRVLHAVT